MMPDENGWHVTQAQLTDYADGRSTLAQAASVEMHLTACAGCRSMLEGLLPEVPLDRMWQHIVSTVDSAPQGRYRHATRRMRMQLWTASFAAAMRRPRRIGVAALVVLLGLTLGVQRTYPQDDEENAGSVTAAAGSPQPVAGLSAHLERDRPHDVSLPTAVASGHSGVPRTSFILASPSTPAFQLPPPSTRVRAPQHHEPRDHIPWRSGRQPE